MKRAPTERLCILMPAYNEADNLPEVVPEALDAVTDAGFEAVVLIVDDGSTDDTRQVTEELAHKDARVSALHLRRNSGKSAALRAGLRHVEGDVVVLMDADGQDDPAAIPQLIDALRAGSDLVTGQRADRQDRFIKRNTSKLYNRSTSIVSGVQGKDFNSGLKAMRIEVAEDLELYGELHRYIPVLAHWAGFRTCEVEVPHRPRRHGESKFGGNRFWRGFFDLLTVNFLVKYNARPLHLFGSVGILLGAAGMGLLTWMLVEKTLGYGIGTRPAFITGIFLVIVAIQMFSLGLIAELFIHARHARSDPTALEMTGALVATDEGKGQVRPSWSTGREHDRTQNSGSGT